MPIIVLVIYNNIVNYNDKSIQSNIMIMQSIVCIPDIIYYRLFQIYQVLTAILLFTLMLILA